MDSSFVEVGFLDLQEVVYSSDDLIITVKMVTTELHFGEEVVQECQIR